MSCQIKKGFYNGNVNIEKELGIESLSFKKILILSRFDSKKLSFFQKQIEEGLTDFSLTIKSGLTDSEKLKVIQGCIDTWDKPGKKIYEL